MQVIFSSKRTYRYGTPNPYTLYQWVKDSGIVAKRYRTVHLDADTALFEALA
jgi:hypothetical protein